MEVIVDWKKVIRDLTEEQNNAPPKKRFKITTQVFQYILENKKQIME